MWQGFLISLLFHFGFFSKEEAGWRSREIKRPLKQEKKVGSGCSGDFEATKNCISRYMLIHPVFENPEGLLLC